MSFNTAGAQPIALDTFGSWVTEMDPADLPPGVSPDNQNCSFLPGTVLSRPGLEKYFPNALANATFVYGKTFILPDGTIQNLFMSSAGTLFYEDVAAGGGTTPLFFTTPGSWCRSITAFGREYIAISDRLHGSDVALQWDGTYLDRYTQDGPGGTPTASNLIIPATTLSTSGSSLVLSVASISTVGPTTRNGVAVWLTIEIVLTAPFNLQQVYPGLAVTVAGATALNGNYVVGATISPSTILCNFVSYANASGAGGTATFATPAQSLTRVGNTVTATDATAHGLQVGYQVQISGLGYSGVGGGVTSIVINNEDLPGLATVTTSLNHTLVPGIQVVITAVSGSSVGGAIVAAVREGDVAKITTTTAHGLAVGSEVTISGVTDASFDGSWQVASVPDDYNFTYVDVDADSSSSGGTVSLNWPIPNTPTPTYFTVETCPTANTFTVQVTYSDGTWTAGAVLFPWDGTFYVTNVVTPQVFQYQQYGPDANITQAGTVTPYGQSAPGPRYCRVSFLLRDGTITRPGPPVQFTTNGGQYITVGNLPIGPPQVVARIVQFTGAFGYNYFYIPVPANAAGTIVSTSTVINDNTTTTAIFDFSDNTLFAALATSIPGNNIRQQMVLDGALNFAAYEGRILTWGQRDTVQNLLNMTMDGGYSAAAATVPAGWDSSISINGALGAPLLSRGSLLQTGWLITCNPMIGNYGLLRQSAYQDGYSNPILLPNTYYSFRAYIQVSANLITGFTNLVATLTSASTGFSSVATILVTPNVGVPGSPETAIYALFLNADFTLATPATIPSDMLLNVYLQNVSNTTSTFGVWTRDWSLYYTESPYLDTVALASYAGNYAAIDFVTGQFGSSSDVRKIMNFSTVRDTLYFLTQEPSGKLHEVQGTTNGEPSSWVVDEVASNCGSVGPFALAVSQADEESASGGEEWMCWMSVAGARIFGGGMVHKISQELQEVLVPGNSLQSQLGTWALNDPVGRIVYFGVAQGVAPTANVMIPLSYRELDSAESIAGAPPFHPSLAGRLVSTDNTRKWSRWVMTMNGGALMVASIESGNPSGNTLVPVFFGGNGATPNSGVGTGNCYTLNASKYQDDDFGAIQSYYITYMFPDADQDQSLQLGGDMKAVKRLTAFISGLGVVTFTLLPQSITNPFPLTGVRALQANPQYDLFWNCGSCTGERIAVKIAVAPVNPAVNLDCWFSLSKLTLWFAKNARQPVRG